MGGTGQDRWLSAVTGQTKDGKESKHTLANTGPRRFLICEFDTGTPDDHAALLLHLGKFAPLVCAVHSGNKSLHGWFYVHGQPDAKIEKFFRYAVSLGADRATWTRSQFVRMPDGTRDNGKRQTVFFHQFQINGGRTVSALIETAEILDPPGADSAPVDLKSAWLEHLAKAICSSSGLAQLNVPPREPILGEWFKEADTGFIFGARGLGKTWLAMHIGRQCAEGGSVADWKVHKPRRVLYVDGEMALDSIRERDAGLSTAPADGMFYLQHEALFHLTGKVLNFTSPIVQAAILEDCLRKKLEVLILDNLSCLFTGIKENDADAWELVLPWLLELRRNRIAVIIIAHAGRNGFMRGTSRREDAAIFSCFTKITFRSTFRKVSA